jgi:hypothetical protein
VHRDQAIGEWETLRDLLPTIGYWPVLGWDRFKEPWWEEEPTEQIITAALQFDAAAWFAQVSVQRSLENDQTPERFNPPLTYHIHTRRYTNTQVPYVPIALVPCNVPWKIPAYLRQPTDSQLEYVHVAVMKYWYERRQAEIVSWSSGEAELRVLQPPTTFEDAAALATEQYCYCPDLVWQVISGVRALARLLVASPIWYFWWD